MTRFFQFFLFLAVVPYDRVVALPPSYPSAAVTATQRYTPLIVVFISLFFLVIAAFAMKLVYMKHRRIGTTHAPPGALRSIRPTSAFGPDKQGKRHRGLLVGCLGSPTWETSLTSKSNGTSWRQRQRSSFAYQLHTRSTRSISAHSRSKNSSSGSHLTKSTAFARYAIHADLLVLPSSSGSSRTHPRHDGSASDPLGSVRRATSTHYRPRYGDFGEFHRVRSSDVPMSLRRASPCSIRLVDGPSHGNQVEYTFLSALPPNSIVASPLMGTRDSFQLSRCALKYHRKPVPPMPSLPSFLPFSLPQGAEAMESHPPVRAREYLPPLRFSPLASVAKVFHSSHQVFEKRASMGRMPDPDGASNAAQTASSSETRDASSVRSPTSLGVAQESSTLQPIRRTASRKANHKKSRSYKALSVGGSLSRLPLMLDEVTALSPEDDKVEPVHTGRMPSGSSRNDGAASKKPLKSCLRQNSVVSMAAVYRPDSMSTHTPSMSDMSTHTSGTRRSTGDQASLRTPITEDDIGMLGLDRFRWNDEIKELKVRSCHMKKDSMALVPVWG